MLLAENKSKNKMIYIQYEKYNKHAYRCVLMALYCMATRFPIFIRNNQSCA